MKTGLIKEIIKRFYFKQRFKLYALVPLSLIAAIFEYAGLVFIFQFVLILSNPSSKYCLYITDFFKNNFQINDFSHISLILGIVIALIYIFKNIYMFLFVQIKAIVLKDMSIKMNMKILKNLLFQNFVTVNSIAAYEKQNTLNKTGTIIWSFIDQYINLITNASIVVILIAFLFIKFTLAAIVSFSFIGLLSYVEYLYIKKKSAYMNKYSVLYSDALNKITHKIINSTKEIRLNHRTKEFISNMEQKYLDCAQISQKRATNSVFHIYFTEISIMITFILVLFVLYFTTEFSNQLLISTIAAICAVILRITPVINRSQCAIYAINSSVKATQDVIEFDNLFEQNFNYEIVEEKLPFEKSIKLQNISFSYDNSFGLKNINLEIKKGDFIGIVGRSGCYKTTLSLIISGLIKAQRGNILIDDKILKDEDFSKWQNNVAILSQDFALVKDNILNSLDFNIIQKLGLEDISNNQLKLSYGQKQRLALGDILSKNKNVLILDEITSSSDVLTEDKINDILLELKGKKTIISIAHRFQILKHCNKIIFMDEAKIIDVGTFTKLSEKYEDFKKMVELSNFKIN